MQNFVVNVEFEGHRYECFVQKINNNQAEKIYVVSLGDSVLINRFHTKRMALCYNNRNELLDELGAAQQVPGSQAAFRYTLLEAIDAKEQVA